MVVSQAKNSCRVLSSGGVSGSGCGFAVDFDLCVRGLCTAGVSQNGQSILRPLAGKGLIKPVDQFSTIFQFSQVFLFLLLFLSTDLLLLKIHHTLPSSSLPSPLFTSTTNPRRNEKPPSSAPSLCVVSAVDYNQLVFFLLANLLTGLVNFSMDTLHTRPPLALTVLVLYMCLLVSLSLLLHRFKIRLKL